MPVFVRHRLLFIHIPKCGGDTVSFGLRARGDPPFLFVADGSVMVNGHTPQHMRWREYLDAGWSTANGFRVAALVRHPVDRVVSEYRYIQMSRPDLRKFAPTPAVFLDHFLTEAPGVRERFDNHNVGLLDFLSGPDGRVDPHIYVRPVQEMGAWLHALGLPELDPQERRNVTAGLRGLARFTTQDVRRIREFFRADIAWFEGRFPGFRSVEEHDLQP